MQQYHGQEYPFQECDGMQTVRNLRTLWIQPLSPSSRQNSKPQKGKKKRYRQRGRFPHIQIRIWKEEGQHAQCLQQNYEDGHVRSAGHFLMFCKNTKRLHVRGFRGLRRIPHTGNG